MNEYHIRHRADGQNGSGTIADPFNGAKGIDTWLTHLRHETDLTLRIGPGVFPTMGVLALEYHQIKAGWHIHGAGMGRTILKLTGVDDSGYNCGLSTWFVDQSNVEVTDLTVDCNYGELSKGQPALELVGVMLYGNDGAVRRVRVVGAAGKRVDQGHELESFALTIRKLGGKGRGAVIEDCEVSKFGGGYVNGIALMALDGGTIRGSVRRNTIIFDQVNPTQFGINFQWCEDSDFSDNKVYGGERGIGNDTGDNSNIQFKDNYFQPDRVAAFIAKSSACIFSGNVIDLMRDGSAGLAFFNEPTIGGKVENWIVRGNVIRNRSQSKHSCGIHTNWAGAPGPTRLLVTDNLIDSTLANVLDSRAGSYVRNSDFDGRSIANLL